MRAAQLLRPPEERNPVSDWTIRIGVAAFYLVFGHEKFSASELHWVTLVREIGIGDWFRYFTGCVEVLGALLVLIPRAPAIGLALLSATMAAAAMILAYRLREDGPSPLPALFFFILAALAWNRYQSDREMSARRADDSSPEQPIA
jgi:putative oxidoreductase